MAKETVAAAPAFTNIGTLSSLTRHSRVCLSSLAEQVEISDSYDKESTQDSISKIDNRDQQFNNTTAHHLFKLHSTNADISLLNKKSKRQASKSDVQKCKYFPYKIYNYIHMAQC